MADDTYSHANTSQPALQIHRPIPRRTFNRPRNDSADSPSHAFSQVTPPSAPETRRSSDFLAQLHARLLRTYDSHNEDAEDHEREPPTPPRNKSFLNMTNSTLFGIYDDVESSTASTAETPWGTGAETPAHSGMGCQSIASGPRTLDGGLSMKTHARRGALEQPEQRRQNSIQSTPNHKLRSIVSNLGKLAALFLFGITYGIIVSHLHDTRQMAAVHVEGVNRESWLYLAAWGCAGVALGSLLPYVDVVWGGTTSAQSSDKDVEKEGASPMSEQINDIVRSVCAFVGIAFAIRRLPWQSTLQLTVTLALVNPALWYILDRSKPGLSFSLIVTSIITSFIFLSNPDVLPSPSLPSIINSTFSTAHHQNDGQHSRHLSQQMSRSATQQPQPPLFAGLITYDNLAVATWVGSVLFCSCVCFGSIGRRLAVLGDFRRKA